MNTIDLTQTGDGRSESFEAYEKNYRMRTFTGSWVDSSKTGGENTWSHLGIYCGQQFGPDVSLQERRLIYLGLLIAYVNGDKCTDWTPEQKQQAIDTAWKFINSNR